MTPECERWCLASSSDLEKRRLQLGQVQAKGFSPVCRRRCAFRCDDLAYSLPQPANGQGKILSSPLGDQDSAVFAWQGR